MLHGLMLLLGKVIVRQIDFWVIGATVSLVSMQCLMPLIFNPLPFRENAVVTFCVLSLSGLLKDTNDVKVLHLKEYSLALEVRTDHLFLLQDGFGTAVNFLEQHLHKVSLADHETGEFFSHLVGFVLLIIANALCQFVSRLLLQIELVFAGQQFLNGFWVERN
jgi:hypothetical protein